MPATSFATSMPVLAPNPRRVHVAYSLRAASAVVLPSLSATFAATTLREYAMASLNFMTPMPWRFALSIFVLAAVEAERPTSLNFVAG